MRLIRAESAVGQCLLPHRIGFRRQHLLGRFRSVDYSAAMFFRCSILFILLSSFVASLASVQQPAETSEPIAKVSTETQRDNSVQGLDQFFTTLLEAARKDDSVAVAALIKEMEIPNYREWFLSMYPEDQARSWIEPYGKRLSERETSMRQLISTLAASDVEIIVRKVNDHPQPGRGLEWGMLHSARSPLDFYFVGWKPRTSTSDTLTPLGYFIYIDGAFRWDSNIDFAFPKIERLSLSSPTTENSEGSGPAPNVVYRVGNDVSAPRPLSTPDPEYSKEARNKHIGGRVVLAAVIGSDGHVYNVKLSQGLGYGLDEEAIRAVKKWKFAPATKDGQPVAVEITIEVNFHG